MWDGFSHSIDSLLDMMLQLSLRCLKKKFTSHHLRPEIPVSEGRTGGQNEYLPCEYVMASDKKIWFHFAFILICLLAHSCLPSATRSSITFSYSNKKRLFTEKDQKAQSAKHYSPSAEPACFSVLRILLVMGRGSLVAEIPSSGTAFCCCRAALHKKELNRTNGYPSEKKTFHIKIFLSWT